jgi:hypothetical protein
MLKLTEPRCRPRPTTPEPDDFKHLWMRTRWCDARLTRPTFARRFLVEFFTAEAQQERCDLKMKHWDVISPARRGRSSEFVTLPLPASKPGKTHALRSMEALLACAGTTAGISAGEHQRRLR